MPFSIPDLVDPLEPIDPSEFELYKENDVLYPTLATLPHLKLDCPVRLAVMGAKDVGKSALAVRYLSGQQAVAEPKPGKLTNDPARLSVCLCGYFIKGKLCHQITAIKITTFLSVRILFSFNAVLSSNKLEGTLVHLN